MCGIVALLLADGNGHANQDLFDSLTALQHRGQGVYYSPSGGGGTMMSVWGQAANGLETL